MWKVLIADASEQWREALETAMGQDYYVRTSPDGPRTLELAEQFEPDVLIMDLMLSGTDGLSVLKALEQRTPRPRIIIPLYRKGFPVGPAMCLPHPCVCSL